MTVQRSPLIGLVVVALALTALPWYRGFAASPPPGVRDAPPGVIANAEIARQRMHQIAQAIFVYMNDNYDRPPVNLSDLYPDLIDDPLVFWHPGDTDPPPTTIDNDVPNAPNSAQISFEVDLAAYLRYCWGETPYIRDNTPNNNGGLFVNEFYGDWYTVPSEMMPTPVDHVIARHHLRSLALALHVYANDNWDWWPQDMMQLVPDAGPPCDSARVFWHPGDDQSMPTQITNSALNGLESAQISFEYLVAGLNENYYDPNLAVFQDNSPSNNGGVGTLVAYCDGRVEYHPLCLGDATADFVLDFDDAVRVMDKLGRFGTAQLWQGDLNADTNTDLHDLALLQIRFGATCGS